MTIGARSVHAALVRRCLFLVIAGSLVWLPSPAAADKAMAKCVKASGGAGATCLKKAVKELGEVVPDDTAALNSVIGKTSRKLTKVTFGSGTCSLAQSEALGYRDQANVKDHIVDQCRVFALDINRQVYFEGGPVASTESETKCQETLYKVAAKVAQTNVKWHGKKCVVVDYDGTCDRTKREDKVAGARAKAVSKIEKKCGADFDTLVTAEGVTLTDRIDAFVEVVETRGRHFAQQVYPPGHLGATAAYGAFPVGLTTLTLADASRLNVAGDGPRPVITEVYYPTTAAAIDGVSREIVELFDIPIVEVPAYRDVDLAAGTYPLIVFSHGNNGIRIQSFFFAAHLASHGYIVVSPDHHGNTFLDGPAAQDPTPSVNRPLDMSFLIDEFTAFDAAPGNFFEGAIDEAKIGASGHSFGGFTSFLLAGDDAGFGSFTDARVKAILPQAPAAGFDTAFMESITVPTLIVGGTIDETTPFATEQQAPFDAMLPGAAVVGLAELANGGHFSFSDFCEVPADLLEFLGGAEEACEPRHLPWRYAQNITRYLSINFFDAVLNGDAGALARLDSAVVNAFDATRYEDK